MFFASLNGSWGRHSLAAGVLLVALTAGGCCRDRMMISQRYVYSRVEVGDFSCRPIAEYIAQGPVQNVPCGGIVIMAVERTIFQPCPITFRYPLGRPVNVVASNIRITPAPEPYWLTCLDGGL